jgi:adenosylhomocysteine nucleosidase
VSGIGLVVALPREIPTGFVRIDNRQRLKPGAFVVYRHMTAGAQLVAVQAGVGRTRAAEGARLLVRRFSPQILVSCGFAGGLAPQLARGTLVIATALVSENSSLALAAVDRVLSTRLLAVAEAEGIPVQRGAIVTTPHLVADAASKSALRARSGACAVDMETAGIVEVARQADLPWVAVRAIIDGAEDSLPLACLAALRDDGYVAVGPLLRMIYHSPQLLWYCLRLARDTATARRHLSQAFERWGNSLAVHRDLELG